MCAVWVCALQWAVEEEGGGHAPPEDLKKNLVCHSGGN